MGSPWHLSSCRTVHTLGTVDLAGHRVSCQGHVSHGVNGRSAAWGAAATHTMVKDDDVDGESSVRVNNGQLMYR